MNGQRHGQRGLKRILLISYKLYHTVDIQTTVPISGLNPNGLEWNGGPNSCQIHDCWQTYPVQICNYAAGQNWGHQCEDCPGRRYSDCQSASYENPRSFDECVERCAVPELSIRANCMNEKYSAAYTDWFYAVGGLDGNVVYVGRTRDEKSGWPMIYYDRNYRHGWNIMFAGTEQRPPTEGSYILPINDSSKGKFMFMLAVHLLQHYCKLDQKNFRIEN